MRARTNEEQELELELELNELMELKRPKIIPPPLCEHLKLVHCIVTEEERFQARIRRWDKRRKLTRLDFY